MSTARFSNVVEQSGKPEPYALWSDPKKDPDFQKALKAHRVMTVHQDAVGSKTDYGTVGYTGDPSATFLLFPKSLAAFEGKRIVGIKYDLLEAQPQSRGGKVKLPKKPASPPKPKATRKPELTNIIPFFVRDDGTDETDEADAASNAAPKRRGKKTDVEAQEPKPAKQKSEAKAARDKSEKPEGKASQKRKAESRKRDVDTTSARTATPSPAELRREILKAMKALKAGKAVVAYEVLEALEAKLSSPDQR